MTKRFASIFLIFLCLSFNLMGLKVQAVAKDSFNQGIYKASDLEISKNSIYKITNLSKTDGIFVVVLNENLIITEAIRLLPGSPSYETLPIKQGYRIIVVGKGNISLIPKQS